MFNNPDILINESPSGLSNRCCIYDFSSLITDKMKFKCLRVGGRKPTNQECFVLLFSKQKRKEQDFS